MYTIAVKKSAIDNQKSNVFPAFRFVLSLNLAVAATAALPMMESEQLTYIIISIVDAMCSDKAEMRLELNGLFGRDPA